MVMMIGIVTMGALVWVLAFCMVGESDAEKRRVMAAVRTRCPADRGTRRGKQETGRVLSSSSEMSRPRSF